MFPVIWNNPYISIAAPNNVNPCEVDVVGNISNQAVFYQILTNEIAFRLRLNGDPRLTQGGEPINDLKPFVWGIQIKDTSGNPIFTIFANGNFQGQRDAIELRIGAMDGASVPGYPDIDPWNPLNTFGPNLEVLSAGSIFPCSPNQAPDADFYLDFKAPLNAFKTSLGSEPFDFAHETYRFCYFTSTNDNNINKEGGTTPPTTITSGDVCGNLINPPVLSLLKLCPIPPASGFFNVGDIITITLKVTNSGSGNATNITVIDKLNVPAGVTISNITTNPLATITPLQATYTNTDILITWTGINVPHNSSVILTASFTLLAAPNAGAVITNLDAGIGELSGTDRFRCLIPVKFQGVRGIKLSDISYIILD